MQDNRFHHKSLLCKSNSGFRLFYNSLLPDHCKLAIFLTVQTQPQPITPNVLFSVEKRRKSQLFDKDKWQQQRLVFAGESDEDQNSQEGDGSVDSEVSSPAMDDDRRKKWLANTSVNRCDECLIHFCLPHGRLRDASFSPSPPGDICLRGVLLLQFPFA